MSHVHGNLQERALLRFRLVLALGRKTTAISPNSTCRTSNSSDQLFAELVTPRPNNWMSVAFVNLAYSCPKSKD
jgi:hypothetical protein